MPPRRFTENPSFFAPIDHYPRELTATILQNGGRIEYVDPSLARLRFGPCLLLPGPFTFAAIYERVLPSDIDWEVLYQQLYHPVAYTYLFPNRDHYVVFLDGQGYQSIVIVQLMPPQEAFFTSILEGIDKRVQTLYNER